MDSNYKHYIERAENELILSQIILKISNDSNLKESIFEINSNKTFYSAVISHCYYSIFYSAKAYLLIHNIKINAPEEHKKTYEKLKEFVENGQLNLELLNFYKVILIRAESILNIFKIEKKKRGKYTYKTLPEAELEFAKSSFSNANKFYTHINNIIINLIEKNE